MAASFLKEDKPTPAHVEVSVIPKALSYLFYSSKQVRAANGFQRGFSSSPCLDTTNQPFPTEVTQARPKQDSI
jgi:hypothetical protein